MHAWSGQLIFWIQSRWCAVMGKFFCTDLNITNWLLPYPAQIISSPKVKIFNKTTPFCIFLCETPAEIWTRFNHGLITESTPVLSVFQYSITSACVWGASPEIFAGSLPLFLAVQKMCGSIWVRATRSATLLSIKSEVVYKELCLQQD